MQKEESWGFCLAWWGAFKQLILPAVTMALFVIAPLARITRASMLVSLGSDFVRTARSIGLSWWRIVVTYALRNAILPVITIAGIVFSTMLGANVLVEKVFSWPGVASYALDALLSTVQELSLDELSQVRRAAPPRFTTRDPKQAQ